MKILLLSFISALLCGSVKSTTFQWLDERSADGVPHLAVTFPDGRMDHAILRRFNPIPQELDATNATIDECIFRGFLANEDDSKVVLTGGCPGSKSFDIGLISKGELYRFRVDDGKSRAIKRSTMDGMPAAPIKPDGYVVPSIPPTSRANAFPKAGFILNLDVYYDQNYNNKYGPESVNAIRRAMALAQLVFDMPSLTVPVELKIVKVELKTVDIIADEPGLIYLQSIPMSSSSALLKVAFTTVGGSGGIAYLGTVCQKSPRLRSSVIKDQRLDQTTAEIVAHEVGHNLNMPHDFIDPFGSPKTPRYDSKGVSCTDDNGVMDYYVTVKKWSTCSVENFLFYYNLFAQGSFCMPLNTAVAVDGNWGSWGEWGTCSKKCLGGTQIRTKPCNNPRPSGGGAYCAGSGSESRDCNTGECPWPGYPFYLCSNQEYSYYSPACPANLKLKILKAGWLRKDTSICQIDATSSSTTSCLLDVTAEAQKTCDGTTSSCDLMWIPDLTDPCPGIDKYFQFNVDCVE